MMRLLKRYGIYLFVTALTMLPLLTPGYILTLDLVFTPELRMPGHIANDYLWYVLLHVLDLVLPSELIQKTILVSIPLLAAIGMHRLVEYLFIYREKPATKASRALNRSGAGKNHFETLGSKNFSPRVSGALDALVAGGPGQWAIYAAGIFYAVNPFTYSRFMSGQYLVLLGYALIPFFVRALLAFLATPNRKTLLIVTGITLLISILSIHTLGMLALIALILLGIAVWQQHTQIPILKQYLQWGAAGLGLVILASSYWLIPLILGRGETAAMIQQFDHTHTQAFATAGSNAVERAAAVFRLQGFWLEARGQFTLPQDQLPGWGTVRLAVWALIGWGIAVCWRQARSLAIALISLGAIGMLLAIGVPEGILTQLGYREPHKFTGIIALVFAISIAVGGTQLLVRIRKQSELRYTFAASILLLVVVLFTPTMYWGFGGQLKPRQYPDDWYTLNARLSREHDDFRTVFAPWHQYMSFDFADRIIAHPANQFFDTPAITSNNPEIGNIRPEPDSTQQEIARLLDRKGKDPDFGARLAAHDIKYIVLTKDFDYRKYQYLDRQDDLERVWDTSTLRLYRNTAYKEDR